MKAVIIAAGPCTRLRPLTDDKPKCMLKINGKPIIQTMLELFGNNGINDISAIRGYKKEKMNIQNITYFENTNFLNNNILHSLMYARTKMEEAIRLGEDVIITYSDIWYSDSVVKKLLVSQDDLVAIVDIDWQDYYEGRTDHPIEEAENVIIDNNKRMLKIGKHIFTHDTPKDKQGEFIGLWKFTAKGTKLFLDYFDTINARLKKNDSFQNAKEWQKAYITDIFQEMIDSGERIYCALIRKNWKEFDTVQDFLNAGGEI